MRNKYKLSLHVKNYIKKELYDYKRNKNRLKELYSNNTSSRTILLITKRIQNIENVFNKLSIDEKQIAERIFFERCNQIYMETKYYITKDIYYNTMNKVIYLVAIEFELI